MSQMNLFIFALFTVFLSAEGLRHEDEDPAIETLLYNYIIYNYIVFLEKKRVGAL